jgi:thioester reductase-like protein
LTVDQAQRQRWVRNFAVALVAVALIMGIAPALPRPVDLQAQIQKFASVEKRTLAAYSEILNRARTEKLRDKEVADAIERDVLFDWVRERESLSQLTGLPARQNRLVSTLVRYMEARQQGWLLMVDGLRQHNLGTVQQANAKQREAENIVREISSSLR